MGLGNMLAQVGLGLLPYAPDIYNVADRLMAPNAPQPPAEVRAAQDLMHDTPMPLVPPPSVPVDVFNAQEFMHSTPGLLDAPGQAPAPSTPAPTPGGGLAPLGAADDPLYGSLGETPFFGGDLATQGAGLLGGAAGSLIASQAFANSRRPYAGMGQQAGSALGGIAAGALAGSALGPVGMFFGALAGAFGGGMLGGAAGSAVGPQPTIGGNFSGTGTFNPDGTISFGGFGGDNGGTAAEAGGFANQFGNDLLALAAQEGLRFNPAMTGVQFNIGGFDNPTRRGVAPGGFFYDPIRGGSPENYALRPGGGGFDPYSAGQSDAFTAAVLADLAARDVFTPTGTGRGMDFYTSSLGAPLGWYGGGGAPTDFDTLFAQRQGEIGGWQAGAEQRAAEHAQMIADRDASYATQVVNVN